MNPETTLPPVPDFEAIERAAAVSAARRAEVFELIGNLVYAWSNNESLLVYFIMQLLGTDRTSAVLVFGTLNTTRARLDLVQRLAKVKVRDRAVMAELKRLLAAFEDGTRVRNDFLHSMFAVDAAGAITHTHAMRIFEKGRRIGYGAAKPVDDERIAELRGAIRGLNELNRELWQFVRRLEISLGAPKGRGSKR